MYIISNCLKLKQYKNENIVYDNIKSICELIN